MKVRVKPANSINDSTNKVSPSGENKNSAMDPKIIQAINVLQTYDKEQLTVIISEIIKIANLDFPTAKAGKRKKKNQPISADSDIKIPTHNSVF